MVRTYILSDEQRKAIQDYLEGRPSLMPYSVRQMRTRAKRLDFPRMREDLALLESLKDLDLQIGRKRSDYRDQVAKFKVRRTKESAVKATAKINPSP